MTAGHNSGKALLLNLLNFLLWKQEKTSLNPNAITFYIIILFKGLCKTKKANAITSYIIILFKGFCKTKKDYNSSTVVYI